MQALKDMLTRRHRPDPPPSSSLPDSPPVFCLPYVRQQQQWDCGVACILSLLRHYGLDSSHAELRRLLNSDSVWSIDILLLLHQLGLTVQYFTTTLGPNPAHRDKAYYASDWQADEARVQRGFQLAADAGIPVHQSSLSTADFLSLLSPPPPPLPAQFLLLLVDPRYLHCPHCQSSPAALSLSAQQFSGHFILCTHRDRQLAAGGVGVDVVHYMDPSGGCERGCVCGLSWLEMARRSEGTDEDIILVSGRRQQQQQQQSDAMT